MMKVLLCLVAIVLLPSRPAEKGPQDSSSPESIRSECGGEQVPIGSSATQTLYLTESNMMSVLKHLYFPSMAELKSRGRPFTLFVEGLIGAGKSTLLEAFTKYPSMDIVTEPASKWNDVNGTDLMKLVYDEPTRWSMTQESYVMLTMLGNHMQHNGLIHGLERSLHSVRFCFIEAFRKSGYLTGVEYAVLDSWYKTITDRDISHFDFSADLIIYLRSDPDVVYNRIRHRGRTEEVKLSREFFAHLHRSHEEWLIFRNASNPFVIPARQLLVIDANLSYEALTRVSRNLAAHIWRLIPSALKNQCLANQPNN